MRMCGSSISYPKEQFPKLIFVSFSIDLARRVKIVILILKDSLVIYERFKWHILCFRRKLRCPREEVFQAARDENYFCQVAVFFRKKKEKETKKKWEDEHWKLYSRRCTDKFEESKVQGACIQRTRPSHNINMINILYKQKVKNQRTRLERHVKLQGDPRRIRGARDSIMISIG